jgi:Cu(I)/Ag(I) efflux system membrane protein CusA/SilA
VIFMLLYIKFRSLSAMLAIFLAIPFAFVGGIWLQWFMQYVPPALGGGYAIKYSTAVWVGYIALFGVAVEDGIVLMEYLLERVRAGEPVDVAAVNAGLLRVRPIIMTTTTTVLALAPIMLYETSTNTGAELMKPIAVPTFGGMITATAANLILAPVLFSLFYWVESWGDRHQRPRDEEAVKKEVPPTSSTEEVVPEEKVVAPTDESADDQNRKDLQMRG